ncbi:MAG: hypothetical protein M3Z09_08840 [Acidobacteriota bacterium]|nr:hypothetical protein [Acidobacteriota bacterium]
MSLLQWRRSKGLLVSASLLTITACSTSPDAAKPHPENTTQPANATPTRSSAAPVPSSLANVGEYGENIYDAAKAGTWTTAAAKLGVLKDAAHRLRSDVTNATTEEDHLDAQIGSLDKAVARKNRVAAMREANQVTLIAANLSQPFNPKIPVDVVKLDYYGRELEVWTAAKDSSKLQTAVAEMRSTWDRVRPSVETHGGSAEAQQFDTLMTQLQNAKTPANYNKTASALLEGVDKLEKVFTR